ncbi:hypothetical protein L3Q82_005137 [Scortum barcoo]|uniref:Uncharacterized protein n=1 Tax=Scortum barcoo TaxID=214431 RepID=A0ACB8VEJ7_9TELE|nr:hypothetical protein L3Q82_005137 [Scortum barcoo]
MRISTSKSEAMVLNRKRVACPLQVGGEVLPQVEEFKYLGVLFTSEGKIERERLTGGLVQRAQQLCGRCNGLDRRGEEGAESERRSSRFTGQSTLPTLTYGHELWRAVDGCVKLFPETAGAAHLNQIPPDPVLHPNPGLHSPAIPRLLKTCAAELGEPLQRIFNLSLQIGRVPTLWKTSRIVPVPKKNRPSELNDFRPVALTSHLMKTLERLFLSLLRPQVQHAQDRLQFAYQPPGVGVEDAILYLLHRAHSHLDKGSGTVRILFLDFSSAFFNTIQPPLASGQTEQDGSGPHPADGLDLRLPHWQTTTSATTRSCVIFRSTLMTRPSLGASGRTERRSIGDW